MGISDMKKYIINILIFFGIVAIVDVVAGKLFWYLQSTRAGGRTGAEYYACKESNENVIIMGSSRASHHYVPQIITDSLGFNCFNAGQDGNGIILQYGRWKLISERYIPKLIIYDVNPSFDLCQTDNMAYVDRLKPFCNDDEVETYVAGIYPMEKLKLFSQMYRYNYKFIEMMFDCLMNSKDNQRGYIPLFGEIRKEIVDKVRPPITASIIEDTVKVHYLKQLAKECKEKGTQLIFVASPAFRGGGYSFETFNSVSRIAEEQSIPFLYYYESNFSENPRLFKDSQHLNNEGAEEFTKEIVGRIRI